MPNTHINDDLMLNPHLQQINKVFLIALWCSQVPNIMSGKQQGNTNREPTDFNLGVEQVSSGISGGNNLHAPWSKDGKRGMAWYGVNRLFHNQNELFHNQNELFLNQGLFHNQNVLFFNHEVFFLNQQLFHN